VKKKYCDKINSLINGVPSTMEFWEVLKFGEFYLIFVFGMLPLFITHNLINLISKAYKKSKKE
jgi:formate hydrogenlyase subunit 3/multisubunit Na+/H+ antiporter MnhD subunit